MGGNKGKSITKGAQSPGGVCCKGWLAAPTVTRSHAFLRHVSGLSSGRPGQGTHPQLWTAKTPGAQWKNPKSLNTSAGAFSGAVTAPLLRDSESKGCRKPVSNLDGSDPRAVYVTGVPETSPRFLSGASSPRRGENFLLGPLPVVILSFRCKMPPKPVLLCCSQIRCGISGNSLTSGPGAGAGFGGEEHLYYFPHWNQVHISAHLKTKGNKLLTSPL